MKIDRLIGILSILLQKETVTAPAYVVPPLEGLWYQKDSSSVIDYSRKDDFCWISMIRLPEFVTREVFDWAVREAAEKKKQIFPKQNFSRFVKDSVYNVCIQGVMTMNLRPYRK